MADRLVLQWPLPVSPGEHVVVVAPSRCCMLNMALRVFPVDPIRHGGGRTLAQRLYRAMLQIDKKPNLNLATLAEAINILRAVLRRYVTEDSQATDDQLLRVMESSGRLQDDKGFRKEVDAFKLGKRDIEDLVDISIVGRIDPGLVERYISGEFCLRFREIKRSTAKVTDWRNKVCHPPFRGISDGDLRTALDRIINLLERIGAYDQELRIVKLLREKPFTQIHYREARENRDLQHQVAQLRASQKCLAQLNAGHIEELQAREQKKTVRRDKKIATLESELTAANERTDQERETRQAAEAQVVQLDAHATSLESQLTAAKAHTDQERETRQAAEAQVVQLDAHATSLESQLTAAKAHTDQERETRQAAEAQVVQLGEEVKALDARLDHETEAKNQYHRRAKRRGVAGTLAFVTALAMVSLLALAIFRPGTFLQVLAPFQPELITTTEIVEELIAIQSVLQARADELASVRSELQERETELATVQTELATQASTAEELRVAQSRLANTEEALTAVQVSLQEAEEALAVAQAAVAAQPDTVLAVPTRVYIGPGTEYESRWVLPAGEPIRLTGTDSSGDWYLLSSRYWILGANIEGQPPGNLPVRTIPSVLADVANLREEPTNNAPVGGVVPAGQTIVLVGQKEGGPPAGTWYQLDSGLWIWGDLVADAPSDLPVLP